MGRTIPCPAGEWTAIFDHAFVQLPFAWTVDFIAADGAPVAGEVRVKRSSWIFPNPPTLMPLEGMMRFERGWWNTFYAVHVRPESDLVARIR